MKVILLPNVLEYFDDLVTILYEREYFGFEETALDYIIELYDDIVSTLPIRSHRPAPKHFDKYGKNMDYAGFRKNRNTIWYVFFQKYKEDGEVIYLVRYIANNHTVAQYLNL